MGHVEEWMAIIFGLYLVIRHEKLGKENAEWYSFFFGRKRTWGVDSEIVDQNFIFIIGLILIVFGFWMLWFGS